MRSIHSSKKEVFRQLLILRCLSNLCLQGNRNGVDSQKHSWLIAMGEFIEVHLAQGPNSWKTMPQLEKIVVGRKFWWDETAILKIAMGQDLGWEMLWRYAPKVNETCVMITVDEEWFLIRMTFAEKCEAQIWWAYLEVV